MNDLQIKVWHSQYKRCLVKMAGFTRKQADEYFDMKMDSPGEFDYGYSPRWYVREEVACGVY